MDTPSNPSGDAFAKGLRDAYGQGCRHAVGVAPESSTAYREKRDAWIRQYMARMPVAVPSVRDGEEVGRLERVRHVKRGFEYEVLGEAEAQVSYDRIGAAHRVGRPLWDECRLTVYRSAETGKLWARFTDEFRDGRFETIAAAPVSSTGDGDGGELERLSKAATSGEWSAEEAGRITAAGTSPGYDIPVWGTILTARDTKDIEDGVTHWATDGERQANARYVAALVNAHRSGRFIPAPPPETWLPIEGWEEFYEVSDHGRVRSLPRRYQDKKGRVWLRPITILNAVTTVVGYPTVSLQSPKKPRWTVSVHRLVAGAFIPNPKGLPFVNHKDSDRSNARVSNLEWCTHQENVAHAKAAGRLTGRPRGHISEKRGFTDDEVRQVRSLKRDGQSSREIANRFGVGLTAIQYIVRGKTYANVIG